MDYTVMKDSCIRSKPGAELRSVDISWKSREERVWGRLRSKDIYIVRVKLVKVKFWETTRVGKVKELLGIVIRDVSWS